MLEAGRGGRIAGQIAAPVMRFSEDDVVDVRRVDARAAHYLRKHRGDQCLGRGVDQRPLERPADRGPGGADNYGCSHVLNLAAVGGQTPGIVSNTVLAIVMV